MQAWFVYDTVLMSLKLISICCVTWFRFSTLRRVFSRTIQIAHSDGLTYDYLYGIASELAESGEMVLMGGGPKGKDPLVFQTNGTPYRGFLEGRVDGKRYQLLLHLSNMELKRPAPAEEEGK